MMRIVRWAFLGIALAFIICCRYMPALAEGYAQTVYPVLSGGLSAISSLFPFPLMEVLVVGLLLLLVLYPIRLRKKRFRLRQIIFREGEILVWVYVWFYLGWGLNYYRYNIYTRLQTPPVAYEEMHFKNFLNEYTEQLNAVYQPTIEMEDEELKEYFLYQPSLGLWINETSIMANAEGIHFYPYLFKGWCTWFYGAFLCRSPT